MICSIAQVHGLLLPWKVLRSKDTLVPEQKSYLAFKAIFCTVCNIHLKLPDCGPCEDTPLVGDKFSGDKI
jgi:hypothetical protein